MAPATLRPPIYSHDPLLNSRIQAFIWSSYGLEYGERVVLTAVLQRIPMPLPLPLYRSPQLLAQDSHTFLIDRILALPPPLLKILARLFTTALLDARSWGDSRPNTSSAGTSLNSTTTGTTTVGTLSIGNAISSSKDPLDFYAPLFTALGISSLPVPVLPNAEDNDSAAAAPSHSHHRSPRQKENCFKRHRNHCPITFRKETLTHAHLIPHSITSLSSSAAAPFWMLLSICLGPDLRDAVFAIVGGSLSFSTTNSIALDSSLHKYFDKGLFHLVPIDPLFDPVRHSTCDVRLLWRGNDSEMRGLMTPLQTRPEEQVVAARSSSSSTQRLAYNVAADAPYRQVGHGDCFRLWTSNKEACPLPHPLLLELHSMLWGMIAAAGMAEPRKGGMKRTHRDAALDSYAGSDSGGAGTRGTGRKARKKGGGGGGGSGGRTGKMETVVPGDGGRGVTQKNIDNRPPTNADHLPSASLSVSLAPACPSTSSSGSHTTNDYETTPPPGSQVKQLPHMPLNRLHMEWIDFQLTMHATSGMEGTGVLGTIDKERSQYNGGSDSDYSDYESDESESGDENVHGCYGF